MEEFIQLRANLLKASKFIRVHNSPMDADQIIENSLQIVNNLIERASAKSESKPEELRLEEVSLLAAYLIELADKKDKYNKTEGFETSDELHKSIDECNHLRWAAEIVKREAAGG